MANRVGAEGDGWRIAMVTFAFERGTGFVSEVVWARRRLVEIAALARENATWEDSEIRRRIARLAAEFDALWALVKRNVSEAEHSAGGIPGPGSSVFKLRFSEARQHLDDLHADVRGRDALAFDDDLCTYDGEPGYERLRSLAYTIAAGTSQVQRNIIGERILGLPKEPSAARAAKTAGAAGAAKTAEVAGGCAVMDFRPTEDQLALAGAVRDVLGKHPAPGTPGEDAARPARRRRGCGALA